MQNPRPSRAGLFFDGATEGTAGNRQCVNSILRQTPGIYGNSRWNISWHHFNFVFWVLFATDTTLSWHFSSCIVFDWRSVPVCYFFVFFLTRHGLIWLKFVCLFVFIFFYRLPCSVDTMEFCFRLATAVIYSLFLQIYIFFFGWQDGFWYLVSLTADRNCQEDFSFFIFPISF